MATGDPSEMTAEKENDMPSDITKGMALQVMKFMHAFYNTLFEEQISCQNLPPMKFGLIFYQYRI